MLNLNSKLVASLIAIAIPSFLPIVSYSQAINSQEEDILSKAINYPGVNNFFVFGSAQTNQIIDDVNVANGKAKRVTAQKGANPWDAAGQIVTNKQILKGDNLVGVAYLKASDATIPNGKVTMRIQLSGAPYTGLVHKTHNINSEWSMYSISVDADKDYNAGDISLAFHFASQKQTIDVGPVFIINMGKPK